MMKNTFITYLFFFVISLDEVSSARSRLSGALNTAERIVDKYAGDDFPISPFKRFQSLDSPFPSPTKSPRGVRRRRKKTVPLNTAFHHTFVMKLFDRSVDLAQFPVQTPLYPVCRAWMKNDPHNTNMAPRLRTPTPEPEENLQNGDDAENATGQLISKCFFGVLVSIKIATRILEYCKDFCPEIF